MNFYQFPSCNMTMIWNSICRSYEWPCIAAACEIGVFDALEIKCLDRDKLIKKLELNEHIGDVFITALASFGYLVIIDKLCHLSEVSREYLLSSSSYSMKKRFVTSINDYLNFKTPKDQLIKALKNLNSSNYNSQIFNSWKNLSINIEEAKLSTEIMHNYSLHSAIYLANKINFKEKFNIDNLLDIAGGSGCFSIAISEKQENIKCTVLEIPTMISVTKDYISKANINKINVIEGNMFVKLPDGYNGHFYSNILHAWSEDEMLILLKNSHDSLTNDGYVYIHELLLNENQDGPLSAACFSLMVCLGTQNGKQHSYSYFKKLLKSTGFKNIGLLPSHNEYSLIFAQKM